MVIALKGSAMPPFYVCLCSIAATHHVSAQVDAEDGNSPQRQRDTSNDEEKEGRDLRDVAGQCVGDRLLQVVKDESA